MNEPINIQDLIDDEGVLTEEGLDVMAELWEEGCLHS
tara:strand:- start:94 stop:204 length:111 start_codon:yes stop_codon:yes gene_type:complete